MAAGRQAERLGGQPPDAFAVHGQLRRARGRHDADAARRFERGQRVGGDGLDLGYDDMRPLGLDQRRERIAVGHRQRVRTVRHLMPRRVGIAVDGDRLDAQSLQRDQHFLAEFAAAEQHDARGRRR